MNKYSDASKLISEILSGMTLDSFKIYNYLIVLEFVNFHVRDNLPNTLWLSNTGKFDVTVQDFFIQNDEIKIINNRAINIAKLCNAIGEKVESTQIYSNGDLQICVGKLKIICGFDSSNSEEIWSLTSDTPEPYESHDWSISLNDMGEVDIKTPSKL